MKKIYRYQLVEIIFVDEIKNMELNDILIIENRWK